MKMAASLIVAFGLFTYATSALADNHKTSWWQPAWSGPWRFDPMMCVDLSKFVFTHNRLTASDSWRIAPPTETKVSKTPHVYSTNLLGLEIIRVFF